MITKELQALHFGRALAYKKDAVHFERSAALYRESASLPGPDGVRDGVRKHQALVAKSFDVVAAELRIIAATFEDIALAFKAIDDSDVDDGFDEGDHE